MRTRIQAIGLGRNGQLVLADAQRKPLVFRQRGANGTRAIELVLAAQDEVVRLVAFERSELGEARITRVARSPRGDQALLDRRGLLHLIPADPREPQMAILLPIDRPTAIWCSDGRVHGPHCFTGTGGPRAEVDAMLALLHAFAEGFA
jgi:hypothetical protein